MANDGTSGPVLGQSLASGLAGASEAQRAALPALATPAGDPTATASKLGAAANGLPADTPAAAASSSIKRNFSDTEDADSAVQCCKRGDGTARSGVDYQNIPDEEYWRYNRYVAECASDGRTPTAADAWQKKSLQARANNKSGYGFEAEVRQILEVPTGKGSRPVRTKEGFVPDLPVGDEYGVTDIKNVATLNDTEQLAAFHGLAKERNLPFNLIVGPNTTHISAPLLKRVRSTGGVVDCYDPSTGSFTRLDIGTAGFWSK
jgi:hypothetical protein